MPRGRLQPPEASVATIAFALGGCQLVCFDHRRTSIDRDHGEHTPIPMPIVHQWAGPLAEETLLGGDESELHAHAEGGAIGSTMMKGPHRSR